MVQAIDNYLFGQLQSYYHHPLRRTFVLQEFYSAYIEEPTTYQHPRSAGLLSTIAYLSTNLRAAALSLFPLHTPVQIAVKPHTAFLQYLQLP